MRPRRTIAILAVAGVAWSGYRHLAPELAEVYVRRELAANGYPDADLEVVTLGVDHTKLTGVILGPGLELGDVGVDVGLSSLWGEHMNEVTIRHARVSRSAMSRPSTTPRRATRLPVARIRVDDSVITDGATEVAVRGKTEPAEDGTIELTFEASARERGKPAWTARGEGTITVASDDLAIREVRARADLVVSEGKLGSLAFTDARLGLDVTATDLAGALATWKVRVRQGRARFAGGELAVEPFELASKTSSKPIDLVVHGKGLQLAKLPGRGTVEASGVVDGRVAVRIDGANIVPLAGELTARPGGRIRLTDPAWRRRLAGAAGEGLAIRERVAGALADLHYSTLTVNLAPPGTTPEMRIALSGRGHALRQEVHLAVNLRGIRDTFHRFVKPTRPRSPSPP